MKDPRSEDAGGRGACAVELTRFATSDFFPSQHLFQAAGARLLCMLTGGGVIPFAAVIGR